MKITLLTIPILSAFIGWFVNWIAIKMLFHPYNPKKILGKTIQGIIPNKQNQIAQNIGKFVSTELFSLDSIQSKINNPKVIDNIMPQINDRLDDFIKNKLPKQMPLLSMFIGSDTTIKIKESISAELKNAIPEMIMQLSNQIKNELDIEKIVTTKISELNIVNIESILKENYKKEFYLLSIFCATIGFIIGLLQMAIINLF